VDTLCEHGTRTATDKHLDRPLSWLVFRLGSFALIFNGDGEILLCHRRDIDAWNLPGGAVEPGESPWKAAVRETREEVGLEVEVDRLAGVYFKPEQGEVVFSFVCRVVDGALSLSDEADAAQYFPVNGLPENTLPKQVQRIRDAATFPGEVVLRDQPGPSTKQLIQASSWPASSSARPETTGGTGLTQPS
jgi:ADP-ribose pyrophosphatase YjhB (NUDIX family)